MKIKNSPFEIDKEKPFANDSLKREPFADKLTNIIVANKDELVIALNGQWGEGKTTFIEMWKAKLELEGFSCIYIDAFKIDYTEDAFTPIALEIDKFVEGKLGSEDSNREEFYKRSVEVGKKLLLWSGKVGIKAITLNAINDSELDSLKSISSDTAEGISEQFNKFAEDKLLSHKNTEGLFESYRHALAEVAHIVGGNDKPLIIIVDELDRCRPKFAVQILEKIKHLFSVQNVVFVLSVNQEQLEHSIKAEYGIGIDANTYLQKFIDIRATLPRFNITESSELISDYHRNLFESYGLNQKLKQVEHQKNFFELISAFLIKNKISYRQSERIILNIKILLSSLSIYNLHYINLLLIAFASYLVTIRPDVISGIYKNEVSCENLVKIRDLENIKSRYLNETVNNLVRYLEYCFVDPQKIYNINDQNYTYFHMQTSEERKINNNPLLGLIEILNTFSYLKSE